MSIFSSIGHAISTGYHDIFGGGNNGGGSAITTTTTTQAPLQKPQNSNSNQPANNGPMLTLQKPGNTNPFGQPTVDASTLTKAAQFQNNQPTTQTTTVDPSVLADQEAARKNSNLYKITHNPVTNVAGNIGKTIAQPFVTLGKGLAYTPEAIGREIQNKPITDIQQKAFGTTDQGQIAKDIVGSTIGAGLTIAAPGLDSAAEAGAARLLPDFAETGLLKAGSRVASNAGIGGAFNTINGVEQGQSPEQLAKSFAEGAAVGGVGGAVFSGLPLLRKAAFPGAAADGLPARAAETASETATDIGGPQAADELATGIKSANPSQAQDAVEQTSANPTNEGAQTSVTTPGEPTAPTPATSVQRPTSPAAQSVREPAAAPQPPEITAPTATAPVEPPVDNTPAFLRKQAAVQADAQARQEAEANAGNLGAGTTALDRPTFLHNQDIQAAINDGEQKLNEFIDQNPTATQAEVEQAQASIRQEVIGNIQKLQDQRAGVSTDAVPAAQAAEAVAKGEPVVAATDVNGNPAQVSSAVAAKQAEAAGVNPNPAPINPAEVQAAEAAVAPTPEVPGAPSGELKNARFQNAVVDNTKDPVFKQAFTSDPIEKTGQPLSELNDAAIQKVQNMDLPSLVDNYGKDFGENSPVTNPQQYYEHLQALRQLEQFSGDPTAADAAANALAAVNDYAYRQGRGLAATKVAYDNMPTSMKVAYVAKMVQKAGGDLSEADMQKLFSAADLQGQLAKTAQEAEQKVSELATQAAQSGGAKGTFNSAMKDALATEEKAQSALYDQNRAIVDIMQHNLPNSPLGDRIAQSARTMMLSSVGGRAFAIMGTGFNTAQFLADNTLSAAFGKGINAVNRLRGSNASAVKTSFANPATLIKGAATGIKGLARDTFSSAPVKNVDQYLKKPVDSEYSHDATRYGFIGQHITAPLRKVIRFGVGSHLALTKGVETSSLEQAARASASELGVPKENMQGYVDFYKSHPPANVAEEAKQAWLGVNNLHQNGVSNALGKFASAIDNLGAKAGGKDGGVISGIAKQVRTVVIPFSHYMGGFVDKMLTDRNSLYNVYRIARARSPQELSDQLGHLTTNVGTTIGLGYGLAKAGIITDKDQDGKNYDGLYFHIGNRYIPVAFAGQAAMPIIMGATYHGALNDGTKGQSWPARLIDTTTKTADSALKAAGVAGTFGSTSGPNQIFAGDSGKGVPAVVGAGVRQHIPGFFGDINSKLDYTSLNPTHEKPLTKATNVNPATGRDVTNTVQTEINKTKAAIPGVAQTLPRQPGEAAHDFIDRMLHSGQASGTQQQAAKDLQKQQTQSQADLAKGIPDPNGQYDTKKGESFEGAVASTIANNEYDKAIPALQQKLAGYGNDNKVDPKTTKKLQDQIKELNVTKQYGQDGQNVRQLYLNTNLSEWRDMGDPNSDTYDPATYKRLYDYDVQLAKNGVSGSSSDSSKNKFTAKTDKNGKGSGSSTIKDNTIGGTPNLPTLSLGDLVPRKVGSAAAIPTIQQLQPGQLVKKRAISVSAVR